ncbi:MAG: BCCT family transporter [Cytophagales bacterium]|nr:BCCT family transporter [Cytophagales bacterium]
MKALFAKLNHWVFWPPFVLLTSALIYSLADSDQFLSYATGANQWILDHFDLAFSYTAFFMVVLCLVVAVSPLGKIKIGGEDAVPILTKWRWFSIILCTTIAVGILFWGVSEPLYHITSPPRGHTAAQSPEAAFEFAMSTMFMHWSFTPYAIYAVPALMFAIGYYNRKLPFSLNTMLFSFSSLQRVKAWDRVLNAICLFALVAGMSAALGAGILSLAGGWAKIFDTDVSPFSLALMTLLIVLSFTISAASGLLKGIRILSGINFFIFVILCGFMMVFGPTRVIFDGFIIGIQSYVQNFIPHSLSLGEFNDKSWTHAWTTFYWAIWMAWAPVTCLFLGRISYGYTVRQFLLFNWLIPSAFSILWMSIFSGTSLHLESSGQLDLVGLLGSKGPEAIIYQIFDYLPGAWLLLVIFLVTMYISYVTAADSSTEAMSGISSFGISPEAPSPPILIKFLWGGIIGLVAWVMVSYSGIDGVRMLSNLGGLPALFLIVLVNVGLVKWLIDKWKM